MNTATIEIPYRSERQTFRLWFVGDVHVGSKACDEEKLLWTIEQIKNDDSARVFLMGDLAEYIPRGEWRFREQMVAEWVDRSDVAASECDWLIEKLKPIKGKILGAIQGNHELTLEDAWNENVHKRLCDKLEIQNLGYSALVRVAFTRKTPRNKGKHYGGEYHSFDIYLHHGFGGGRTDGADANRFSDLQRDYLADIYVMGHTHRYFGSKSVYHFLNKSGNLDARCRLVGRSGTFLKTVIEGAMNYAERSAMRPQNTGALQVVVCPSKKDFEAII